MDELKKGHKAIGRTYKNHIDGYNFLPYLTGEVKKGPHNAYFYFSDDGDLIALRFDNWKVVFMEQRCHGTRQVWAEPFTRLRLPKIYNLRTDPYEFADTTSNTYWDWFAQNAILVIISQQIVGKFMETFKEFSPVQKPNTFTIDDALAKLSEPSGGRYQVNYGRP